jgi:hypothetical protein
MNYTEHTKVCTLLVYQGEEAGSFIRHIKDLLTQRQILYRVTSQDPDNMENDIYRRFYDVALGCEAAISIVTRDARPASKAGNLWLETGLWLGLKSESTLMLCVQKHQDVEVPSDLLGRVGCRFVSEKDLDQYILSHIHYVEKKLRGEQYPLKEEYAFQSRIRDTLIPTLSVEEKEMLSHCAIDGNQRECVHKRESLRFISELLRMGKVSREYCVLTECLLQIARFSAETLATDELDTTPIERRRERHTRMKKLDESLKRLQKGAQRLLTRSHQADQLESEWERLERYFSYRLSCANDLQTKNLTKSEIKELEESTQAFLEWAQDYLQHYKKWKYFNDGCPRGERGVDHEAEREANRVLDYGAEYAQNVGFLLRSIADQYFMGCRTAIKHSITNSTELERLPMAFHDIRENFPHNVKSAYLPRIWPRVGG